MVFFTSDTHWFHKNILAYCGRPFYYVQQMDQVMLENWNRTVQPEDTIYHLGDVAMGSYDRLCHIVPQLTGRKILIRGNHDRSAAKMLQAGFDEVHKSLDLEIEGRLVLLRHKPYVQKEPPLGDTYDYVLHGHVHQLWKNRGSRINVGVDVRLFTPITFSQAIVGIEPGFFDTKMPEINERL